jgi:hypothetical protein
MRSTDDLVVAADPHGPHETPVTAFSGQTGSQIFIFRLPLVQYHVMTLSDGSENVVTVTHLAGRDVFNHKTNEIREEPNIQLN